MYADEVCDDDGTLIEDAYIVFNDDKAEYWTVDFVLTRLLMEADDYDEQVGSYVFHELEHLRMWQFSSFAKNLCRGDKALVKELTKLEEQIVQQNEEIFSSLTWKRNK